jgi:hypothetical protein
VTALLHKKGSCGISDELKSLAANSIAAADRDNSDKVTLLKNMEKDISLQLGQSQRIKSASFKKRNSNGSRAFMPKSRSVKEDNIMKS